MVERTQYHRDWYAKNIVKRREDAKRYAMEARFKCIAHYSNGLNVCLCCEEDEYRFLTIDHINNDGYKHKNIRGYFCSWLVSQGYPEGYQVLCMNCNFGKSCNNGVCPHKERLKNKEYIYINSPIV